MELPEQTVDRGTTGEGAPAFLLARPSIFDDGYRHLLHIIYGTLVG